jgi:hypothetical protein
MTLTLLFYYLLVIIPTLSAIHLGILFSNRVEEVLPPQPKNIWQAVIIGVLLIPLLAGGIFILVNLPNLAAGAYLVIISVNCANALFSARLDKRLAGKIHSLIAAQIVTGLLAFILGSLWYFFQSWLINDLTVLLVVISLLSFLGALPLRYVVVISLVGTVLYDIFGVPLSGLIPQTVASGGELQLPIHFFVPRDPFNLAIQSDGSWGMGDIFVPGYLMKCAVKAGYRRGPYIGYAVGVVVSYTVARTIGGFVPALVFMVPIVILGIGIEHLVRSKRA